MDNTAFCHEVKGHPRAMSSHNKHLHSSEAGLLVWVTPFYFLNPQSYIQTPMLQRKL